MHTGLKKPMETPNTPEFHLWISRTVGSITARVIQSPVSCPDSTSTWLNEAVKSRGGLLGTKLLPAADATEMKYSETKAHLLPFLGLKSMPDVVSSTGHLLLWVCGNHHLRALKKSSLNFSAWLSLIGSEVCKYRWQGTIQKQLMRLPFSHRLELQSFC